MRPVRHWLTTVVVASLVFGSAPGFGVAVFAEEGAPGTKPASTELSKSAKSVAVKPGELTGRVLYPDGVIPAADAPVRVWSVAEKRSVYETTTDSSGNYKLPALKEGRYFLVFGDRVVVDLRVDASAKLTGQPINVIIPRGKALLSREEIAEELALLSEGKRPRAGGGRLLRTRLMYGGAALAAIGLGFAVTQDGDGGRTIVSP